MKAQVKIIKLINGDDIVTVLPTGEHQLPDNGPLIRLDKPLQIKYIPQVTPMGFRDYIALIRWTNYTGDKIVTIPKDKIMTIVNANPDMTKSYHHVVLGYDKSEPLAKKEQPMKFKRERLSDEDNDKVNEIFDEFEDDEFIPKKTLH